MDKIVRFLLIIFSMTWMGCKNESKNEFKSSETDGKEHPMEMASMEWQAPDTSDLVRNDSADLILYGKKLIINTSSFFGPHGSLSQDANGLNCQNCHLEGGTKLYANSFSAVNASYPKFRDRSGTVERLEKRINDCMERSLNGKKIDSVGNEMKAMVLYINWVGKDVKKGSIPQGAAVIDLPFLNRAADIEKGKKGYETLCFSCHGIEGNGLLKTDKVTFLYPPLWGPQSYNTAAGMYRLSRLAGFIKCNMPFGSANKYNIILTDAEAWDIAAYVNSMPRPEKKFAADWPDISKKPVDYPFGPYADNFSAAQHKYGPFAEILEAAD